MTTMRGRPKSTGWTGWIAFAAAMMMMVGLFNVIDGLVAIFADEVFVASETGVYVFDLTAWGWWILVYGVVLVATGLALLAGKAWARFVAVVVVLFNAVSHAAFMPAYPFWSLLIIAVDVFVLWALIVHGDEPIVS